MSMREISIDKICFDLYRPMLSSVANIQRALRQLPLLFFTALVMASSGFLGPDAGHCAAALPDPLP